VRYLQREGVVVHGLRHPNIVRVIGLDPFAERPYLVMELVEGPALYAVVKNTPKGCRCRTSLPSCAAFSAPWPPPIRQTSFIAI